MFKPVALLALASSAYNYVNLAFHSDAVKTTTSPHVAAHSTDRNGRVRCVRNLTAPSVVLMSASCVTNDIPIGAAFVNDTTTADTIEAKRAVVHPAYDTQTHANDMAVLQLVRGSHSKPVAISWDPLMDGTKVNPELLEVGVTAWDNVDCAFSYDMVAGRGAIPDSVLCTGGDAAQACVGDAGDALTVASANGDDHLVAVFSWSVERRPRGAWRVHASSKVQGALVRGALHREGVPSLQLLRIEVMCSCWIDYVRIK
ncbi:hypothetical protein DYB35_010838 [Aphanomyces astaci]|uniref:Peptidase S1 domain-containing protein n=1 Tax=Aphanomyces astaci TaxID=112090 RepID=A0A3R7EG53_APHAT|nr:hypothetical protein DYB35_010838 [Aphanomyces astaci]